MNILLLGPMVNKKNPLFVGGAITAFDNLISFCNKSNIEFEIIDTNKKNYRNIFFAYISILYQIFVKQKNVSHISLHSSKDYIFFGIFIVLVGKIFKKKTSLRKFGGDALQYYTESNYITKKILKYIYTNIDILFFEIKYIVNYFENINKSTFWFPNVRNRGIKPSFPRKYNKKFVFISHVSKSKGIDEILEVSLQLDKSNVIDIYGLITDIKYNKKYFEKYNVTYKGLLLPEEVLKTLNNYDVLLLPSYKEGYPGIIIEAYSLGIPAITTRLQSIEEIVDNYQTGILVEQRSVSELYHAMKYFNPENYSRISKMAYHKFDMFNSAIQTKLFFKRLKNE